MNEFLLKPLKKKRTRQLSRFMAQEMLYDYLKDNLDSERQRAMQEYLPTCPDTQRELEHLRRGLELCERLQDVRVGEAVLDKILVTKPKSDKILSGFHPKNWPEFIRWSGEALLLAGLVAIGVVFIPWGQVSRMFPKHSTDITLTEIKRQKVPDLELAAGPAPPALVPLPQPVHDKPTPAQLARTEALEEGPSLPVKGPMKGVLYRAFMSFDDTNEVADQIRSLITELGGTKAGQVELGWQKPGGRYYHFTFPEKNFAKFQERLQSIGPVRISRESHPRVMPSGKIRIILWIEDKNLQQ
jgi:hypothetical protein